MIDAGQRTDSPHGLLIETDDLFRGAAERLHGDIEGEDVARIESGFLRLQGEEGLEQHAGAGEKHERGGDLSDGKDAEPAIGGA